MNDATKEWIQVVLLFIVLITILMLLKKSGEKPHKVVIDGKEYIRMREWTGRQYQTIILPIDSIKK